MKKLPGVILTERTEEEERQEYVKSLQLTLSKDDLTDKQLKDFTRRSNGYASSPNQISATADIEAMSPNHLEQIISQKRVHVFMKHRARQRLSKNNNGDNKVKIQKLKNTLNIPRNKMPQIRREYIEDFIKSLKKLGVSVTKRYIAVKSLKPTQAEINMNKVKEKQENFVSGAKTPKPFMVSDDNFILDGHHQLFALQTIDPTTRVYCYHIGVLMRVLLVLAGNFPKTTYKEIDD